ncbi:MAG TPA: helix-turn-helix domain-containing protein [Candidatus Saccharimonadales bacterium]|nr:helix-turn-helix domain-containing protein [Candidatus Saccharimonadales bacterium]
MQETRQPTQLLSTTVEILGDKWTPLIVKALSDGPRRFGQLQQDTCGVCPRTLSKRLAFLGEVEIVTKKTFAEIPPHTEYELTEKGSQLLPILRSMVEWSRKYAPGEITC